MFKNYLKILNLRINCNSNSLSKSNQMILQHLMKVNSNSLFRSSKSSNICFQLLMTKFTRFAWVNSNRKQLLKSALTTVGISKQFWSRINAKKRFCSASVRTKSKIGGSLSQNHFTQVTSVKMVVWIWMYQRSSFLSAPIRLKKNLDTFNNGLWKGSRKTYQTRDRWKKSFNIWNVSYWFIQRISSWVRTASTGGHSSLKITRNMWSKIRFRTTKKAGWF